MKISTPLMRLLVFAGGLWLSTNVAAQSTTYPNRPIRMIVPYPAGGGIDAVARAVAQGLSEKLGQPIVIDNKAGATGTIGAESAARATPDGYTILMAANPEMVIAPALTPATVRYNVDKDFAPIALVAESPNIIIAHPSVSGTLADVLSGKANVDLAISSPGQGSPQHMALEVINAASPHKLLIAQYKGAAPVVAEVLGGQVKLGISGAPPVMPNLKAGKLRGLAVTQEKRSPLAPDIPTVEEVTGIKGLTAYTTWYGLLAPAATPTPILDVLRKATAAVLANPALKAKFTSMGTELVALPATTFGERMRAESRQYADTIKRFNIKAE